MKLLFILIFLCFTANSFAHEKYSRDELNYSEFGNIIKKNGDTIYGFIKIMDVFGSNKITIKVTDEKKIKVLTNEIRFITAGDKIFKVFNSADYLGKIIDTVNPVKIYETYSNEKSGGGFQSIPGQAAISYPEQITLFYSYIIKAENAEPIVIYERSFMKLSVNYNKQLARIFSNKSDILKYIDSLEVLTFDEIPKTIEHINTLYK